MGVADMSLQEIKALARVIDRVDYYRLLKLDPNANADALRTPTTRRAAASTPTRISRSRPTCATRST